jgi:hypothetical protein
MRAMVHRLLLAAAVAGACGAPGWAQTTRQQAEINILDSQLRAREAMADRQAVFQQNHLSSLDAQLRTQQSLADVRAQAYSPMLPPPAAATSAPYSAAPYIDASQLASIPDDKLAASNARVREAAANHH